MITKKNKNYKLIGNPDCVCEDCVCDFKGRFIKCPKKEDDTHDNTF